jgi:hypothetical protein
MTEFPNKISRELAERYGQEALAIGEGGFYHAPSGKRVDIAREISAAVAGSVLIHRNVLFPRRTWVNAPQSLS